MFAELCDRMEDGMDEYESREERANRTSDANFYWEPMRKMLADFELFVLLGQRLEATGDSKYAERRDGIQSRIQQRLEAINSYALCRGVEPSRWRWLEETLKSERLIADLHREATQNWLYERPIVSFEGLLALCSLGTVKPMEPRRGIFNDDCDIEVGEGL